MAEVRVFVEGRPVPQGSMKARALIQPCQRCTSTSWCGDRGACIPLRDERGAFLGGKRPQGTVYHSSDADVREWRAAIRAALLPHKALLPVVGPVEVLAVFAVHRPVNHRGRPRGGQAVGPMIQAGVERPRPTVTPDIDKVLRAVLDALTEARAYDDDAQVVSVVSEQVYTTASEGLYLRLRRAFGLSDDVAHFLGGMGVKPGGDGDLWPAAMVSSQGSLL